MQNNTRYYSDRLEYSLIAPSDIDNCLSYYMNEDCMRYVTGKAMSKEEAGIKFSSILKENSKHPEAGFFKVRLKENKVYIGIAKFELHSSEQAEAGYGLLPSFWGKGYGSEVLKFLIGHTNLFPEIKELTGIINPANSASKNVLLKQGFSWYGAGIEDKKQVEYYQLILNKSVV